MRETPQEAPEALGADARRAGELAKRRIGEGWLCALTEQCGHILSELVLGPPAKTEITAAELAGRMRGVRRLLRALPHPPCLVTVARSNEGGNMPLVATIAVEEAMLAALEEAFGSGEGAGGKGGGLPSAAQYTAAAVSPEAMDRIAREAQLAMPPEGRVF